MELLSQSKNGALYHFEFKAEEDGRTLNFRMTFEFAWRFIEPNSDLRYLISFFSTGEEKSFPYEMKKELKSIPLHIPHFIGRDMFKSIMDYFIKQTSAPIVVTINQHPGYPVTVVTYNGSIIESVDVNNLIYTIMAAIGNAEISEEEKTVSEAAETNEDDEFDENIILDYEEDPELMGLIKKPPVNEYLPLKGE